VGALCLAALSVSMVSGCPPTPTTVVGEHASDMKWERYGKPSVNPAPTIYRTEVPGGWLVAPASGDGLIYVPDAEHRWLRDVKQVPAPTAAAPVLPEASGR
jgi:hypothetical protein